MHGCCRLEATGSRVEAGLQGDRCGYTWVLRSKSVEDLPNVPTHYAFLSPLLSSAGASSLTVFGGDGTQQHLSSTILLPMSSFCKEFQVVLLMLYVIFRCSMFATANVMHGGAAAGINQSSQSSLSAFFLLNNSLAHCE
jgi:hypothetical protein